ncbi:hypothetical protein ACLOJK_023123 [Asimina triloba]
MEEEEEEEEEELMEANGVLKESEEIDSGVGGVGAALTGKSLISEEGERIGVPPPDEGRLFRNPKLLSAVRKR